MSALVSFIVPAYDAERTLDRCLRSILAQDLPLRGIGMEVIVVDNGSRDATSAIARSHPVRLLDEPTPGPAAARNRGIEEARGDRIALIDSDCEIPPDWAARALAILEEHDGVCAVGGPGRLPEDSVLARCMNGLHYGVRPSGPGRFVRSLATMNGMYLGAVLRKHRFDTSYFMAEDPELNLRLIEAGYRLLFDPALAVVHHHPTSLRGILRKWYEYGIQYPLPYLRRRRPLADPGFLPRILYIPALAALVVASLFYHMVWIGAAAWILALPAAYFLLGLRAVRGVDRLVFPLFHTAKQWAQMIGMLVGVAAPAHRVRRREARA